MGQGSEKLVEERGQKTQEAERSEYKSYQWCGEHQDRKNG
jgi:hypothetical protein